MHVCACQHVHVACQSHSCRIRKEKLYFTILSIVLSKHTHILCRLKTKARRLRVGALFHYTTDLYIECRVPNRLIIKKTFMNDVHSIVIYFIRIFFILMGDLVVFFLPSPMFCSSFSLLLCQKKRNTSRSLVPSIRLFPFISP